MKLTAFILIGLLACQVGATNYYVDTAGNDANSGVDSANAWKTPYFAGSAGVLGSGDTVFFFDGVFTIVHQDSNYYNISGGEDYMMQCNVDNITYKAYPGTTPIIQSDTTWGKDWGAGAAYINPVIVQADTVTFDSLEFKFGVKYGIDCNSSVGYLTVKNCIFDSIAYDDAGDGTGANQAGLSGRNTANHYFQWRIHDNLFFDIQGRAAIQTYNVDSNFYYNNEIRNCGTGGAWGSIVHKTSDNFENQYWYVYNNRIYTDGTTTWQPSNAIHILWADSAMHDYYIYDNVIYGSAGFSTAAIVTSWRAGTVGQGKGSWNVYIYNNTADLSETAGDFIWQVIGDQTYNFKIFNNLVYKYDGFAALVINDENVDDGINGCCPADSNWISNYNAYYQTSVNKDLYRWNIDNSYNAWNLQEWRDTVANGLGTGYIGDANSQIFSGADTANIFTNRAGRDYTLGSGATAFIVSGGTQIDGLGHSWIGAEEPDATSAGSKMTGTASASGNTRLE